jgi:nitrogen fixation NifU-like protein
MTVTGGFDDDLASLYREVIVEHGRKPRNFGPLEGANRHVEGVNPLCGDQLDIALRIVDGTIEDVAFTGSGCAISQASASLMTEAIKGRDAEDVRALFSRVHAMFTGDEATAGDVTTLGKLAALSGVSAYPARVKCASLSWQALRRALDDDSADVPVSTE